MSQRAESRLRSRNRPGRVIAMCTAVLLVLALIVGYARTSSSSARAGRSRLVAQDRAVARANQLEALDARLVVARRAVARVRKASAVAARTEVRAARRPRVATTFVASAANPCAAIVGRGGTAAQRLARRARQRERRQALYYLNLSCPAA